MADNKSLAGEIDALEALLGKIAAVTARDDDQRRFELVALRRELASRIASVGVAGEAVFGGSPHHADYRAKFSKMRSMAAIHQAQWPAVLLGERGDEFRASAAAMKEANRDFMTWARQALARSG